MNKILTAQQVLEQQRKDHGMTASTSVPATTSELDAIETFLTEFAGGGVATFFKFTKGSYATRDGATIPCGSEFIVPYPALLVGWIRFNGEGVKPTRHMGKLFEGFLPPSRPSLGDDDRTKWDLGLDGKPADPWMMQMLLPLIATKTDERHVFQTTSITGRNAVGKVIAACRTMKWKDPNFYPIVRLDISGFQHRDSRIGMVKVPAFPIIGKAPRDGTPMPETPIGDDLDDEIPF